MKFAINVLLFMLIIWFISIILGVAALMALWWFTKGSIKG